VDSPRGFKGTISGRLERTFFGQEPRGRKFSDQRLRLGNFNMLPIHDRYLEAA
jgi:hypothetical protein